MECGNDGYHVEHHANPECHWTRLPAQARAASVSTLPPVLRWLGYPLLESLERIVLGSGRLQRLVLERHRRAIARLLAGSAAIVAITIVGGGQFPRSIIVLRSLYPRAHIRVVDASAQNIETARRYLTGAETGQDVDFAQASFTPEQANASIDLLVLPLALIGERQAYCSRPRAKRILVHAWLWQRQSRCTAVVAPWLVKRDSFVVGR
jgi:hypothetical protein